MEKRKRPVTYAETLQAKKFAEDLDRKLIDEEKALLPKLETSMTGIEVDTLPSHGILYPEDFTVYFAPLTFGEMKFLSGSSIQDKESIEFFLSKITTNIDVKDLTYFDFFYITVLIKLATFGIGEYNIVFECSECGNENTGSFSSADVIFEELRVPFPVTAEGDSGKSYEFKPLTVGSYLHLVNRKVEDDWDEYMSYCIQGEETHLAQLETMKKEFKGVSASILEMIDASFYHGVQDIPVKCSHEEIINTGKYDVEGVEITRKEVCGKVHNIPFQSLSEFTITTDGCKESIRNRIHFGLQDAHKSN